MYLVKSTKIKIFLISFFVLGIINTPFFSYAEMQIEVQADEINITTSPNNPEPYQDVTIRLSSYATDLNKASITWQNGSKTVLSGIGATSYSFKTLGVGSYSLFNITIIPSGSMSSITKKVSIYPSEIEIMWESVDGYTPPFYKGKSLPVSGSLIKAVAIPNTETIQLGNGSISYIWKNRDSVIPNASGYNKNSYVFKNSIFDEINNITVTASSVSGNYRAENTTQIPIYNPKLIFYKKSPTEGVLYNKALSKEMSMPEDEMTFLAEAYYMTLKDNEKDFRYSWKINGEEIGTPSKRNEMTVRPASRGGYATINLVVENIGELFQEISNTLKIKI
jgi:hypothetical protein